MPLEEKPYTHHKITPPKMKRYISLALIGIMLFPTVAFAQQNTILPSKSETITNCQNFFDELGESGIHDLFFDTSGAEEDSPELDIAMQEDILACAIETGQIKLWMIPFFIRGIANFFIGIAGTVSVLFVLLGGFWYMTGGVTDDKEKGKKTIMYALIGLVITLIAWTIVNVIMVQVTG